MKRGYLALFGFLLFMFGFVSIILNMVGLRLSYLALLDTWGHLVGFIFKLIMIFGGIVVMYMDLVPIDPD